MRQVLAGVAGLVMALAPGMATALACEEYSIRDAYLYHEAREATYVLVQGEFSGLRRIDPAAVDLTSFVGAGKAEVWTGRFAGFGPSRRAFDQPFEAEVVLVFPDFSMIGGGYDSAVATEWLTGQNGLVWLQKSEAGYLLVAELCAPLIDSDPASVKPALRCLAGGYCPASG